MSTSYASSSNNPYARKYLTKGRRSSESFGYLDAKPYIMEPKNKKIKQDTYEANCKHNSFNSESYNFLNDNNEMSNDFSEFYESNYDNYLNYNENQHISDENNAFVDPGMEEFSIDFIDDADNSLIDNVGKYYEQPIYNDTFVNSRSIAAPTRSKRKQGIVGRPTLSSPKRLLIPDNVYSYVPNDNDKYFTDNNHRVRNTSYNVRHFAKKIDLEDSFQRGISNRARPRILLKPSMSDYRCVNEPQYSYMVTEQDANHVAQRQVANREFARNLVARAERQGTFIDKNKIPLSVFEQEPVDLLYPSCLDSPIGGLAEIKESELQEPQMYSINDVRKSNQTMFTPSSVVVVKKAEPPIPIPITQSPMTASDLLKQKWKAASRHRRS